MGQSVAEGDTIATLTPTITSVTVLAIPQSTLASPHVILVDGKPIAVPESGVIVDPTALAFIQASDAYASYAANMPSTDSAASSAQITISPLAFAYQLATPLNVLAVPAATLFGLTGSTGCVCSATKTVAVTIVGSQLGRTFVTLPAGVALSRVSLETGADTPCR